MRTYAWDSQLNVGAQGVEVVANYLRQHGFHVQDVQEDKHFRHQDIDLLVRGKRKHHFKTVEVKTDTYESGNVYLELSYSSGNPGCVFSSRAQVWCYWLVSLGTLLLIDLPKLQLWLMSHGSEYKQTQVTSIRGNRRWSVFGVAVPYKSLVAAGVAAEVRLEREAESCLLSA